MPKAARGGKKAAAKRSSNKKAPPKRRKRTATEIAWSTAMAPVKTAVEQYFHELCRATPGAARKNKKVWLFGSSCFLARR